MTLRSSRHRVSRDECGDAQILTRTGCVYEYCPSLLAVQVDGHPKVAARLKRLGYRVIQEGDSEVTVLVAPGDLDAIAPLISPRRKRQLSAEAKAALVSRFGRPEAEGFSAPQPRKRPQAI